MTMIKGYKKDIRTHGDQNLSNYDKYGNPIESIKPKRNYRMSYTELEEKGDRLVYMIVSEQERKGFFCIPNYGHSKGVDILVISIKNGRIKAVYECKNYAKYSRYGKAEYVKSEKFFEEVDRLNQFDVLKEKVEKWYVVSYAEILTPEQKEILRLNNIRLRIIGYES